MKIKTLITAMAITAMPLCAGAQESIGIKMENLDQKVAPGMDFYRYACGGWMQSHPLPAAYSRYGSFDKLGEDNNERINSILTELTSKTYPLGSLEQKIGDLYRLSMDSVRRNKEGVAPVMPRINRIEKCKSIDELLQYVYDYRKQGTGFFAGAGYGADAKDSKNNILHVGQGGLSLGQKEYYINTDSANLALMDAYRKHMVKMFKLFGFKEKEATKKMNLILDLETRIAQYSLSRTEMRDVEKRYNKFTLAEFESRYPHFPLIKLLAAEGIDKKYAQSLIVSAPTFMDGLDKEIANLKVDELKAYLEWREISGSASVLSDEVAEESFDFNGRIRTGRAEDHPRWRKATNLVQSVLGEPLGKLYCERYFPASSKERMTELVRNLQIALGERIDAQEWMSDETKKVAHEKLSTFYVKIGYPDKWEDYSALIIDPEKSLYENLEAANVFMTDLENSKTVGKPVDRDEWGMTPQTVNAYYNPTTNEICFPAGILQYPFFDAEADDAFNYGAIGVVIGHEMTHGFDDQGSHFDKDGNMSDWWLAQDVENFKKLGDMYADFFSQIDVLPGVKANGRMTLGENLADHGGLQVAFQAYKNATNDKEQKCVNGLTADQRFFIAYAGVWGQNITEKEIRNRLLNDVHSQGEWRVNGALPHINAWYDAFGVKEGDALYIAPEKRLKLW